MAFLHRLNKVILRKFVRIHHILQALPLRIPALYNHWQMKFAAIYFIVQRISKPEWKIET